MAYMLGLKPRTNLRLALPHWSAARALVGAPAWTDPGAVDYSANLPADIGMMGNDQYGDCVFAAGYHLLQVLTKTSRGVEITEPDAKVLEGYSELTGFDPNNPSTDQGTDPDQFFHYGLTTGLPIEPSPAPRVRHKFIAGYEIDYRNMTDLREGIDCCGAAFVAFNVPAYIMPSGSPPLKVWDVDPTGDQSILGGHMVLAVGFNADQSLVIASWGEHDYSMTPAFLQAFGVQTNVVIDPSWLQTTGKTVLGMTEVELAAQMATLTRG